MDRLYYRAGPRSKNRRPRHLNGSGYNDDDGRGEHTDNVKAFVEDCGYTSVWDIFPASGSCGSGCRISDPVHGQRCGEAAGGVQLYRGERLRR